MKRTIIPYKLGSAFGTILALKFSRSGFSGSEEAGKRRESRASLGLGTPVGTRSTTLVVDQLILRSINQSRFPGSVGACAVCSNEALLVSTKE
jgi:hypothetical protein